MKKSIYFFLPLALIYLYFSNKETRYDLIITRVFLIDGTGKPGQENANVYVKDGKIVKISKGRIKPGNGKMIDGSGKYLIPGLFDLHVHPSPAGFVPYDSTDFAKTFAQLSHFGVTTILVPGCSRCSYQNMEYMHRLSNSDALSAPRVFYTSPHFTMEGRHPVKSYPSDNWVDGKTVYYIKETFQIEPLVKKAAENRAIGIKVTIENGPTPPFVERMPAEFVMKIVKEAKKNNLKVFAHISDLEELRRALAAGVTDMIHYIGIDIDPERDKLLIDSLVRNKVNFVTTFMVVKGMIYPSFPDWLDRPEITGIFDKEEIESLREKPELLKSSKGLFRFFLGKEEGTLRDILLPSLKDLKFLYNKGINIALGTDIGQPNIFPGLSLHEEMEIMEMGGFTPLEIIKMASHNGAKMLGVLEESGTIEKGKRADMVLLNKNPLERITNTLSINTVFKGGKKQKRLN